MWRLWISPAAAVSMAVKRPLLNGIINRVNRIGLELEGGWDAAVRGHQVIRDGSVVFDRPRTRVNLMTGEAEYVVPHPKYAVGEIVSSPMAPDQAAEWLRRAYPQHVNGTCGLHVHMSFNHKLNYSRLLTPDYMGFVIQELQAWGIRNDISRTEGQGAMFWNRLDPHHPWTLQHCTHQFLGDKQVTVAKKDFNSRGKDYSRYTFINYCDMQHGTVECRGLPMFESPEVAISAVNAVLDATNRFLSKIRQREKVVAAVIPVMRESFQEIGTVVR
jgi:hypothetical protein